MKKSKQSRTGEELHNQVARLVSASNDICDWLDQNGMSPIDHSVYPCPCCNNVVLAYCMGNDTLRRFVQLERDFWGYARERLPLHGSLLQALSQQPFEPLFSARLEDQEDGEWTLVVQPCASTYGVEFPAHDFWKGVRESTTHEERLAS